MNAVSFTREFDACVGHAKAGAKPDGELDIWYYSKKFNKQWPAMKRAMLADGWSGGEIDYAYKNAGQAAE